MATVQTVTDDIGTYYYIDSSSSRDVLNLTQMKSNGSYIWKYIQLTYPGWSFNAVCGMLGNIRWEGVMNPSQWQYGLGKSEDGGYGLCQWTPATKLLSWLTEKGIARTTMKGQIDRIDYESKNGLQWGSTTAYPMSFSEFLSSDKTPQELAVFWLYDYERPKDPASTVDVRKEWAGYWYEWLSGEEPPNPPPEPPVPPIKLEMHGMPIWLYHRYHGE